MKHCNNNCKECNFAIKETYHTYSNKPPFEKEINIIIGCEFDSPQKPNIRGHTTLHYECPTCHNELNYHEEFCSKCRTQIDWSNE